MKKLVALFLCMVLCFSLVTSAGATDADSLLAQLRNGNSGAVALPELEGNWYLYQISHEGGVEKHGMFGSWYFTQFKEDGSGYIFVQDFLSSYPAYSWDVTWKNVSDTEAELVFDGETLAMTYDGQFLSFTRADGSTWQFVNGGTDVGWEIQDEMTYLSYGEKSDAENAEIEGYFKAAAVFYQTENGMRYIKFGKETMPCDTLIKVEQNWSGEDNLYSIQLAQNREEGFGDLNSYEEFEEAFYAQESIYINEEVNCLDDKSFENVVLTAQDGSELTITSFYNQQWKPSCLLQMNGVYYICMPVY